MIQQATKSICNECYAEIGAVADPFQEDVPMLYKVCPEHGMQRAVLEGDREFYHAYNTYQKKNHYNILIINVTDRCNITCPHCFYPVKNAWDMPLDSFKSAINHFRDNFTGFIISGGDPTCWEHYFEAAEWCKAEGIMLSQLTNGVRFADEGFFSRMVTQFQTKEFLRAELSIHPDGYNKPEVKVAQIQVLHKLRELGLKATCVMINIDPKQCSMIETDTIMEEVFIFMQEWRDVVATFRLRPICFGWAAAQAPTLYLSHLVKSLRRTCERHAASMKLSHLKDTDNIYNQNFLIDDIDVVTVCAAPSVENIDLGYMGRGPWMLANDGRPYLVPHALIVNQGISKGWYRGQSLAGK